MWLLYQLINWIIWLYSLLIVIDAIFSWMPMLRDSVLGQLLARVVDPYLNLFRRGPIARLAYSTGIDLSTIIGLFILYMLQNLLSDLIFRLILHV
ncbi:MAG: YggT family protein [Lactobacillus sp.]|nr:YggT family protein [Lactobacillus sp.]MDN6052408.1 YggT family protein [Lactobacillus sp.]